MKNNVGFSTKEVSRLLGVELITLYKAVARCRLMPPQRVGETYVWNKKNISEAARLFGVDIDIFATKKVNVISS